MRRLILPAGALNRMCTVVSHQPGSHPGHAATLLTGIPSGLNIIRSSVSILLEFFLRTRPVLPHVLRDPAMLSCCKNSGVSCGSTSVVRPHRVQHVHCGSSFAGGRCAVAVSGVTCQAHKGSDAAASNVLLSRRSAMGLLAALPLLQQATAAQAVQGLTAGRIPGISHRHQCRAFFLHLVTVCMK